MPSGGGAVASETASDLASGVRTFLRGVEALVFAPGTSFSSSCFWVVGLLKWRTKMERKTEKEKVSFFLDNFFVREKKIKKNSTLLLLLLLFFTHLLTRGLGVRPRSQPQHRLDIRLLEPSIASKKLEPVAVER